MEKLSPRERIERVVCWAGLNTSSFANHIGLTSPQTLYQIKAEKYNISRTVAERIVRAYPEISFSWLLSGEGEMIVPQKAPVPRYREDCREVALGISGLIPDGEVVIEGCGDCEFVAPYESRSMEPEIKQGSLLFCVEVSHDALQEGAIYLVAMSHRAFVGRLVSLTCESLLFGGGEATAPTKIDPTQIKTLYRVKATLEWKNI